MTEIRYVVGYGKTKHILDPDRPHTDTENDGYGLCGVFGGYPFTSPHRPVCQHCTRQLHKNSAQPERQQQQPQPPSEALNQ